MGNAIGFESGSLLLNSNSDFGKKFYWFGAGKILSRHTDIIKGNGERPTQGLHNSTTIVGLNILLILLH